MDNGILVIIPKNGLCCYEETKTALFEARVF